MAKKVAQNALFQSHIWITYRFIHIRMCKMSMETLSSTSNYQDLLVGSCYSVCGAAGTASFNCKQTAAKDFGWGANEALNSASLAVVANNEWLLIATSGCQRVVAKCNEWLLIAMSGCEQRVVAGTFGAGVFWKLVYVLMTRPGKKISTTEFLYMRAIFSDQLV